MSYVAVRLIGGLGNQMFQYATARNVARRLNLPLLIDNYELTHSSAQPGFTKREYELGCFRLPQEFLDENESIRIRSAAGTGVRNVLRNLLTSGTKINYYREEGMRFDEKIFDQTAPLYLDGYWQSEKYFAEIKSQLIAEDFSFISPADDNDSELHRMISQENCVSVHIRRGDYVSDPHTAAYHGVLSLSYYSNAAQRINELTGARNFVVFSDDISWAQENLKLPYNVTFVNSNAERTACRDLELMRNCRHHIIANSSFSWWGAWLGEARDSKIIAPATWFANDRVGSNEIVPSRWERV